jgi:hypothetical protein
MLNGLLDDQKLPEDSVRRSFDEWWTDLASKVESIIDEYSEASAQQKAERPERDLIEEILELVMAILSWIYKNIQRCRKRSAIGT